MYHHTQVGRITLVALGATIALDLALLAFIRHPLVNVLLVALVAVFALTAVLFSSLTVTVDSRSVTIRFGPGPIRKRIELADIRDAQPVRNPWWYGWGIHMTPDGWVWNVSGLDAVELTLGGGRRFRIGTDEPQALAEAIVHGSRGARR